MKVIQSVLVALSLIGPAVISASAQASVCYEASDDSVVMACALEGRALNALDELKARLEKTSHPDLQNAARYCRSIIIESDRLATLLQASASDSAVQAQLDKVGAQVLSLNRTKSKLKSLYPSDRALIAALSDVSERYFALVDLLGLPIEE